MQAQAESGRPAGLAPVAAPAPGQADAAEAGPMPSRGTILLVGHDTGVGGAQTLSRVLGAWLRDRTRFDLRFVAMDGGGLVHAFREIAPTLVLGDLPAAARAQALADFAELLVDRMA